MPSAIAGVDGEPLTCPVHTGRSVPTLSGVIIGTVRRWCWRAIAPSAPIAMMKRIIAYTPAFRRTSLRPRRSITRSNPPDSGSIELTRSRSASRRSAIDASDRCAKSLASLLRQLADRGCFDAQGGTRLDGGELQELRQDDGGSLPGGELR